MRISDWSSDVCSSDLLIRFKCVRDFVKPICLAFVNPDSGFAELTERPLAMRHHDQTGFSSKISKGLLRLLLELGIPDGRDFVGNIHVERSEEHTSDLQSLMRISYAVFSLKQHTRPTHYLSTLS